VLLCLLEIHMEVLGKTVGLFCWEGREKGGNTKLAVGRNLGEMVRQHAQVSFGPSFPCQSLHSTNIKCCAQLTPLFPLSLSLSICLSHSHHLSLSIYLYSFRMYEEDREWIVTVCASVTFDIL